MRAVHAEAGDITLYDASGGCAVSAYDRAESGAALRARAAQKC